ncbi:MAG: SurA N-terminal domain-containing protein, partial [Candidatus Omnitrophica bacterium]|nr:SurA N-terminal domain-containing protein [Candidatus Omnitrophota bacterium]
DGLDEVLNMLIEDKLIITYAKKKDVEVSDSWVKGRLDEIAASYGSQTEFESVLIAKGLTMATLRAKIADQYLSKFVVEREIKATITISPAEVRDYYIQNIDKFTMPEVYKFVMASSNDKVELDMMAGVIADSGIKIAMSEYKDALTEIELPIEDMRKDMADVIRTIEQNAYKLALIEDKYYLIYLESIVPPQKRELRDVQPVVYGMLWETEFKKRFGEWIEKLKEESVIKILSE